MKTKLLTVFAASALLIGMNVEAQVNTNGTNGSGNVSGNAGGAPASLDIDFETLAKWMLRRAHTINFDVIASDMEQNGVKNVKLGFSAEGALVYQYELAGDKIEQWDDIGRNAGAQILPYSFQIQPDGQRKLSISAFALRNMNTLQNTDHGIDGNLSAVFKVVDRLDVMNVTWDKGLSFSNLNTFDMTAINTGLRVGLSTNDRKTSYLAVRAGGTVGAGTTQMTDANQYGYDSNQSMGFNTEYSGGLEINLQARSNVRLNIQSNYVGGYGEVKMNNISQGETQTMVRNSAYVKNSLDLSVPLRISRRPVRLGIGANVNLVLYDQMSNQSTSVGVAAPVIDLSGNYLQQFRGRLYLNF